MVTQNLSRGDPVWQTPEGRAAVDKELTMLLRSGAFSFDEVMEEEQARALFPEALFVPLNGIMALKHAELPPEFHVLKCRIVAGGDQIRDATGAKHTGRDDDRAMLSS